MKQCYFVVCLFIMSTIPVEPINNEQVGLSVEQFDTNNVQPPDNLTTDKSFLFRIENIANNQVYKETKRAANQHIQNMLFITPYQQENRQIVQMIFKVGAPQASHKEERPLKARGYPAFLLGGGLLVIILSLLLVITFLADNDSEVRVDAKSC